MSGAPAARPHVLDASKLPSYAYGHRSMMWWGTAGMMSIEATVFALAAVAYFYAWTRVDQWPPSVPPPSLVWGTLNALIFTVSAWPNQWTKRVAEAEDLAKVRRGLIIMTAIGAAALIVRAFEFGALNTRWDTSTYGSTLWMLLALHTVHLATDWYDTFVLTVLMHTDQIEGKRFVDVSENALYWYFVIIAWLPIYAIVYVTPRVL